MVFLIFFVMIMFEVCWKWMVVGCCGLVRIGVSVLKVLVSLGWWWWVLVRVVLRCLVLNGR